MAISKDNKSTATTDKKVAAVEKPKVVMYRVKALSCTGKGNTVFKLNQVLSGFKFNNPEELAELGFLEKQD